MVIVIFFKQKVKHLEFIASEVFSFLLFFLYVMLKLITLTAGHEKQSGHNFWMPEIFDHFLGKFIDKTL